MRRLQLSQRSKHHAARRWWCQMACLSFLSVAMENVNSVFLCFAWTLVNSYEDGQQKNGGLLCLSTVL